jgi:hypothetical protein
VSLSLSLCVTACTLGGCSDGYSTSPGAIHLGDTIVSESGALLITATSGSNETLQRGTNELELTVERTSDHARADGLELSMTPFMPAMGHGSATQPTVSALGEGQYRFTSLELSMPGLWELRTTIAGPFQDSVVLRLEVR